MSRKRQPIPSLSINLALPLMRETNPNANELRTPGDIYRELAPIISGLAKEAFVVLTVTTKYRLIDTHMISLGILDACLVHPPRSIQAGDYGQRRRHDTGPQPPERRHQPEPRGHQTNPPANRSKPDHGY